MTFRIEESHPPKVITFKRGDLVKSESLDRNVFYVMVTRDSDNGFFHGTVLASNSRLYVTGEVSTSWPSKDFTQVTKATIFYER